MKKLLALVLLAGLAACADEPTAPDAASSDVLAPSFAPANHLGGFDYKLNIIGVPNGKNADMDDNNGRRIFVLLNGGAPVCVTDADWDAYQDLLGIPEAEQTDNPYPCTEDEWADVNHLKGGRGKVTGGWRAENGLDKVNKILLTPNTEDLFAVLDANATDEDGAEFTMPDDVYGKYEVYARALGKPNGKAAITLCANETEETVNGDYPDEVETWCSINQAVLTRTTGKPRSEDVTDVLFTLTILVDNDDLKDTALTYCLADNGLIEWPEDADPATDDPLQIADVPIFHSCFEDYFWNYDNNGLKLLQLRFFRVTS